MEGPSPLQVVVPELLCRLKKYAPTRDWLNSPKHSGGIEFVSSTKTSCQFVRYHHYPFVSPKNGATMLSRHVRVVPLTHLYSGHRSVWANHGESHFLDVNEPAQRSHQP